LSRFVDDYWGNARFESGGSELGSLERTQAWIDQFPRTSQTPLLEALTLTLERTYVREEGVSDYFTGLISNPDFWRNTHICRGALRGESHDVTTDLVITAIHERLGKDALADGRTDWRNARNHMFIDDAIFSGSRVIEDYGQWWIRRADREGRTPADGPLNLYFWTYVSHQSGRERIEEWVDANLRIHGHAIKVFFVSRHVYEDRDQFRNSSDVLWPSVMTECARESRLHLASRHDLLRASGEGRSAVFPDERQRCILESELLDASVYISRQLQRPWTPLGYGRKPFGFGSLTIAYRNCPNNAPLALWWSLPGWVALFPRATYAHRESNAVDSYDDVPF
jgi:hypothetical protein